MNQDSVTHVLTHMGYLCPDCASPQHIFRLNSPIRMYALAFSDVFINQIERAQLSASFRLIAHKFPRLHAVPMAGRLWLPRGHFPPPLPRLRQRHLQNLFSADALHLFLVHAIALLSEFLRDLLAAQRRVAKGHLHNFQRQLCFASGSGLS